MAGIPEDKIAEIRARTDIVRAVGRVVDLKKAGRSWKGLCPFHQEKTPSFHVNPDKQIFYCFGCHAGGDVISFLMDFQGQTFPEVVRELARDAGVDLPDASEPDDPAARAERAHRARIIEAHAAASELYERILWEAPVGAPGRETLAERGIGEAVARTFSLGYSPLRNDLRTRLVRAGVSEALLQDSGIIAQGAHGTYERFRGRLMVPIREADGKMIAFGARLVEGDHPAKYLNSPETPVYKKAATLFGLDLAREHIRRSGAAIVVEGYFDVIALHQAGVKNVVATCGTALTDAHCKLLARHARDLFLVFDGDAAGSEAAARAHEVVEAVPSLVARVVALPQGEDPDTFVRAQGAEAFQALCEQAVPIAEVLIERALTGVGPSVEDKVRAVEAVRPILVRVRGELARDLYVQKVAARLGMEERTLRAHLRGRSDLRPSGPAPQRPQTAPVAVEAGPPPTMHERDLCQLVFEHPSLLERLTDEVMEDVANPGVKKLLVSLRESWSARHAIDVAGAIESFPDPGLRAHWRAHMARVAAAAGDDASDADDATSVFRTASFLVQRILEDAYKRRKTALIARHAREGTDPDIAAEALQKLNEDRRERLRRASA